MLIVHLFVSYAHVKVCHFFSSSWFRGLAAASACGSSWTFLFTFFQFQDTEYEVHSTGVFLCTYIGGKFWTRKLKNIVQTYSRANFRIADQVVGTEDNVR